MLQKEPYRRAGHLLCRIEILKKDTKRERKKSKIIIFRGCFERTKVYASDVYSTSSLSILNFNLCQRLKQRHIKTQQNHSHRTFISWCGSTLLHYNLYHLLKTKESLFISIMQQHTVPVENCSITCYTFVYMFVASHAAHILN